MFEIKFGRRPKTFRPGEILDAEIHWKEEVPGKTVTARIRWFTVGKGTTSSLEVHQELVQFNSTTGVHEVRFQLPRGPLSCEGKRLTIQWAIQVEGLSLRSSSQKEELFYLAHDALPIRLNSFPVAEDKKAVIPKFS